MKIRQPMTACLLAVAVMGAAPARPGGAQVRAPAVAPSKAADQSVTCAADGDERRALRSAPPGSKRISAHVLAVKYRSGVRQFVDKRPYRDELSGFHWHYCGYSPALKAHLVGMDDESLFSGKLLFDDGGLLLDAGEAVYPSPDGKLFLAASQEDGDELEDWRVSDLSGKTLWAGPSGLVDHKDLRAEYEKPRWIANGVLQVVATCINAVGPKGVATLTIGGGPARWRSDLKCGG